MLAKSSGSFGVQRQPAGSRNHLGVPLRGNACRLAQSKKSLQAKQNETLINDLFIPLLYSPALSIASLDGREDNFSRVPSDRIPGFRSRSCVRALARSVSHLFCTAEYRDD